MPLFDDDENKPSSTTTFPDGSAVTIRFKPGMMGCAGDEPKRKFLLEVERVKRMESHIRRIKYDITRSTDDEQSIKLKADLEGWEGALRKLNCPYADFIFAVGKSWDLKEVATDNHKPFTMESILSIHPTRRQKITMDMIRELGMVESVQAA